MKLIIQIPCYNEEESLPVTLEALPRQLPGIDAIEWLVIDDGSRDRTVEVARERGVDHVVRLPQHQGLAKAFAAGLEACIRLGADIIVNTDADNQYNAEDIPKLIQPILENRAEIVIGSRPIAEIEHFSLAKKLLQRMGSWVVRVASHTSVPDAPSGFRAFSRDAAMRLNVFSGYTYTLETIIQAGSKNMAITSVSVRTNPYLRPSRLMPGMGRYIRSSLLIILRIFMTYQPARFFGIPGVVAFGIGFLLGVRFIYLNYVAQTGGGNIQSLILAALLLGVGATLIVAGLFADLIAVNRKLLEETRYRLMQLEFRLDQREKKQ